MANGMQPPRVAPVESTGYIGELIEGGADLLVTGLEGSGVIDGPATSGDTTGGFQTPTNGGGGGVATRGIDGLIELVGDPARPLGEQEAILFGSFRMNALAGIILFVAIIAAIAWLLWRAFNPKRKPRPRRRKAF